VCARANANVACVYVLLVFAIIMSRRDLDNGKYRTLRQFTEEVMRLFGNCEAYNGPDSEFTAEAIRQRKAFQKQLSLLQESLKGGDQNNSTSVSKRRRGELQESKAGVSARNTGSAGMSRGRSRGGMRSSLKEESSEEEEREEEREEEEEEYSSDDSGSSRGGRDRRRRAPRSAAKRARLVPSDGEQYPTSVSETMEELYSNLVAEDSEGIFAEPVTDDVAPGYSQEISRPTDLQKIR
jgi:hypothetical protein